MSSRGPGVFTSPSVPADSYRRSGTCSPSLDDSAVVITTLALPSDHHVVTDESGARSVPEAASWQKEQFSLAFVHAVATRAGCTIADWKVDKDGVDVTLRQGGRMVDLQMKCTCVPRVTQAGYSFPLDTKTYDKLRDAERSAPGYLGLVIAPENIEDWIDHRPEEILMACHGYWAKIQDRSDPAVGDTKSITLSSDNVLDAAAIRDMLDFSLEMIRRGVA